MVTYGLSEDADIRATDVQQEGRRMRFTAWLPGEREGPSRCSLNLPGVHNVRNALGALAIAWELGLDVRGASGCLAEFKGVGRRFAELGELPLRQRTGARWWKTTATTPPSWRPPCRRPAAAGRTAGMVVVFQPHRYTRTRDLFDDFSRVLSGADALVITDVYPAGEAPLEGIDSHALCQSIRARGTVDPVLVPNIDDVPATLDNLVRNDDMVLLLGAGSMDRVAQALRRARRRHGGRSMSALAACRKPATPLGFRPRGPAAGRRQRRARGVAERRRRGGALVHPQRHRV